MKPILATGRRKTSVSRVYLKEGKGNVLINRISINEYFKTTELKYSVMKPLSVLKLEEKFDIKINVNGGGIRGQADATSLAIARAIEKYDPDHRLILKQQRLLTRDPRKVERKKYGQKKARKKFQFSKR